MILPGSSGPNAAAASKFPVMVTEPSGEAATPLAVSQPAPPACLAHTTLPDVGVGEQGLDPPAPALPAVPPAPVPVTPELADEAPPVPAPEAAAASARAAGSSLQPQARAVPIVRAKRKRGRMAHVIARSPAF